MRIAAALAALAAIVLSALLFMKSQEAPVRTLPETGSGVVEAVSVPRALPAAVEPAAVPAPEKAETAAPAGSPQPPRTVRFEDAAVQSLPPEEAVCLRFGPVAESRLTRLRGRIERTGQLDRMLIEPADTTERVVFAGPYGSQTKARSALEAFRRGGLDGGAVEAHGEGAWIVTFARTKSRPLAERWAREAAAAFSLTNVVVEERGRRRAMVNLVFPNLSAEENARIRTALGAAEGGVFAACPF